MRDNELEVWLENWQATPVVCAAGTIRLGTVSSLYDLTAQAALAAPSRIVFDFSRVATIDSAGLGVVVAARKKLGGHSGCVGVFALSEQVRGAFELAGLNHCLLSCLDAEPRAFEDTRFVAG